MPISHDDDTILRNGTARNGIFGTPADNTTIDEKGDIVFTGGGGLAFGEISVKDNAVATTLNSGAKVQVNVFDTNGPSNNSAPDHTSDDITVTKAGICFICVSMTVINDAAQQVELDMSVWINNGATELTNIHANRSLTGGSGDVGSISMTGFADLAADDTIEVWAEITVAADRDVIFQDVTLSIIQIGGT